MRFVIGLDYFKSRLKREFGCWQEEFQVSGREGVERLDRDGTWCEQDAIAAGNGKIV